MSTIHSAVPLRPGLSIPLALLLLSFFALPAPAAAGEGAAQSPTAEVAPPTAAGDAACTESVWLISARQTGCCCANPPRLRFWRHLGCSWVPANLEEFLASDVPGMPTCFWIH